MTLSALITFAVGASGLSIATDSPDAFCPPVEEARATILARVGEVTGGNYEVRYGMVHDVGAGTHAVRMVLRDVDRSELLFSRDIPLAGSQCSDVAAAMALIVESYFSQSLKSDPQTDQVDPGREEPIAGVLSQERTSVADDSQARGARPAAPALPPAKPQTARRYWLSAGVGVARRSYLQLGAELRLAFSDQWSLAAGATTELVNPPLEEEYRLRLHRHALYLTPLIELSSLPDFKLRMGPQVSAHLQVAHLLGDGTYQEERGWRSAVGIGAHLESAWRLSPRAELGVMGGASIFSGRTKFLVDRAGFLPQQVLPYPDWLWELSLFGSLGF